MFANEGREFTWFLLPFLAITRSIDGHQKPFSRPTYMETRPCKLSQWLLPLFSSSIKRSRCLDNKLDAISIDRPLDWAGRKFQSNIATTRNRWAQEMNSRLLCSCLIWFSFVPSIQIGLKVFDSKPSEFVSNGDESLRSPFCCTSTSCASFWSSKWRFVSATLLSRSTSNLLTLLLK